ncbi:MAG TPA: sulfotransferase [Chloroflexota bacterium]|nr:sulfotransferase [Chloroflexota bacterium]
MDSTGRNCPTIQVIGAGLGRTGTYSLKHALEALGFDPCYHMRETFGRPDHAEFWLAAARGEAVDWDQGLAGYRATVDFPAAVFYDQLAVHYPEARVILTIRDPERWYQSCLNSIHGPMARAANRDEVPLDDPEIAMIMTIVWQQTFGGRFSDRDHAIAVYERHNREVQERIPAERLLVYEVRQGWEPLCDFLGVDPPADVPFPHLNTSEEWQARNPLVP